MLRHFINLIIGSCANDNYQYFCSDKLIHDTDIGITEFDFQETRQIITLLISQRLSIAVGIFDCWADEFDDLDEDYEPDEFFSD